MGNPTARPALREAALRALKQGDFDLAEKSMAEGNYALADLIEDLHIYEAELVIQNEELIATQLSSDLALARFQSLFAHLPLPVLVLDANGEIIDSNARASELLGLHSRLQHVFLVRLIDPDYQVEIASLFAGATEQSARFFQEVRFSVGSPPLVADVHIAPLPSSKTRSKELICAIVDQRSAILQRQAQRESDAHQRLAAAVFAAAGEGVLVTDAQCQIMAVNPMFTVVTGYSSAEALGRNPSFLASGRHGKAFYENLWYTLSQNDRWHGEIWNRRKDGTVYPQELIITVIRDGDGQVTRYVGLMRDITDIKRHEADLHILANQDTLTGLPNRFYTNTHIGHLCERARRNNTRLAVLFIDLDNFKHVNDSLGHPAGDEVLLLVVQRVRLRLRGSDTLSRFGGDEFLMIVDGLSAPQDAAVVAREVVASLSAPFLLSSGHEVFLGASVGISLFPDDGQDPDSLIQHADNAMYQAKSGGRKTFAFYTQDMTRAAEQLLRLQVELRRAVDLQEFVVHYQPVFRTSGGVAGAVVVGYEALVRWQRPGQEALVAPGSFIALAEETGLINPIGEWVLLQACWRAQRRLQAGESLDFMAVNVSARQFADPGFMACVRKALDLSGLNPIHLELELTESVLMAQPEDSALLLKNLRQLGIRLAIDDFGTGYSSLAYLQKFPLDTLKIDKRFVDGVAYRSGDEAIVRAIIALANTLGLTTLAEGVETEQQLSVLEALGCHLYQGFLLGRPVP